MDVTVGLATFNVENLFAGAKALDTSSFADSEPVLESFDDCNRFAAKPIYIKADKAQQLELTLPGAGARGPRMTTEQGPVQ